MKEFEMVLVKSSQIHSVGYDPINNLLRIRFKDWHGEPGSLYEYRQFPAEEFMKFQEAESLGRHFTQNIKPHKELYPYSRIE